MKRCEHKRYTFRKGRISLFYFLFSPSLSLSHTFLNFSFSSSLLLVLRVSLSSSSPSLFLLFPSPCWTRTPPNAPPALPLQRTPNRRRPPDCRHPQIAGDHLNKDCRQSPINPPETRHPPKLSTLCWYPQKSTEKFIVFWEPWAWSVFVYEEINGRVRCDLGRGRWGSNSLFFPAVLGNHGVMVV
jgi:hypothetical protein